MPDLPELPRLDRRTFPVDERRLDAALTTARQRVRRRLLAASPVVAAAVVLSVGGPGTTATLRPVTPATTAPTEVPTTEPSPSATATARPTAKPKPTTQPPVVVPTLLPTPTPAVPPPPEPPEPTPTRRWSVTDPDCPGYVPEANYCPNGDHTYFTDDKELTATARYAYVDGGAPAECSNEGSHYTDDDGTEKTPEEYERREEDAKRWCFGLTGPSSLRSGDGARYATRICRASEAEPFTLKRAHYNSGRPLWGQPVRWTMLEVAPATGRTDDPEQPASVGAYPPGADELLVRPGDCLEWSMRWEARTGGGAARPLPPGEYTMEPELFWFRNYSTLGAAMPTLAITVTR